MGETISKLSADRPLDDPRLDRLGYSPFAKQLAKSIINLTPVEGIVLGIFGGLGLLAVAWTGENAKALRVFSIFLVAGSAAQFITYSEDATDHGSPLAAPAHSSDDAGEIEEAPEHEPGANETGHPDHSP